MYNLIINEDCTQLNGMQGGYIMSIYDYSVIGADGNDISLRDYEEFLTDRNGNVVARFEPTHDMKDIDSQLEKYL